MYTPTYLEALYDQNKLNISLLKKNAQDYCGKTLDEAVIAGFPAQYASSYCTMGLYIPSLLVDAYGFDINTQYVIVTSEINDVDIDWSLGAMLIQLDNSLEKIAEQKTHISGASELSVHFCFVLSLGILFKNILI